MSLTYKNFANVEILSKLRNIRYANNEMLFGFYNTIALELDFEIDVSQFIQQADCVARTFYTYRSLFDMKRFLGQYQEDWLRLLHEAFIYDKVRCIYYGLNSINMFNMPSDSYAFPGNVLMLNELTKLSFKYDTKDTQPFSLYVNIKHSGKIMEILQPIFDVYPDVKEGISGILNVPSYVNQRYESILKGLYYGKIYLQSRKSNKMDLFDMVPLNDETIASIAVGDSNPLTNSFLSRNGKKFFFILPASESGPNALRFNESLFIGRAMGFTSNQVNISGNGIYNVADRDVDSDPFTRDEVYALTGLRSEIVPYTRDQINEYLGINSYIRKEEAKLDNEDSGGKRTTP